MFLPLRTKWPNSDNGWIDCGDAIIEHVSNHCRAKSIHEVQKRQNVICWFSRYHASAQHQGKYKGYFFQIHVMIQYYQVYQKLRKVIIISLSYIKQGKYSKGACGSFSGYGSGTKRCHQSQRFMAYTCQVGREVKSQRRSILEFHYCEYLIFFQISINRFLSKIFFSSFQWTKYSEKPISIQMG